MSKIFFRVDSGNHIGTGHVMRCMALAHGFRKNGDQVFFITKNHLGFLKEFIEKSFSLYVISGGVQSVLPLESLADYRCWLGSDVQDDLQKTNEIISQHNGADLVIVDHYGINADYEKKINCLQVAVIDDLTNRAHHCHFLLNQSIGIKKIDYKNLVNSENTQFLLGPQFALLRDEFCELRKLVDPKKFNRAIKNIMVFFGQKDAAGDTLKLAKLIDFKKHQSIDFNFVLGNAHQDYGQLSLLISSYSNAQLIDLSDQFAQLMLKTDLFIGAGGATSWERACLGVASAVLIVADNQTTNCRELEANQIALNLGWSSEINLEKWNKFFEQKINDQEYWYQTRKKGFDLVDGLGVQRVVEQMCELSLRKVDHTDKDILLDWRNNPLVYKYALNPTPVAPSHHYSWFERVLKNPDCYFYMGIFQGKKCGTVRYDLLDIKGVANVSISIDPNHWGKGIAYRLMRMAEERLKKDSEVDIIYATVLDENITSKKLFIKSGFEYDKNQYRKNIRK